MSDQFKKDLETWAKDAPFDPEKVGSILWRLGSGGDWRTEDHSGMQGDTIESVEVGDYDKLLAMWRTQQESIRSLGGDVRAVANVLKARKL